MTTESTEIAFVEACGLFDPNWYLNEYPDVRALQMSPAEHYVRYGSRLMRDPNPEFSATVYAKAHPALKDADINPLLHYATYQGAHLCLAPAALCAEIRHTIVGKLSNLGSGKIKGFLDKADAHTISGWAIETDRPGKPVELSIYLNGTFLLDFSTSLSRHDVSARGMAGERAGFSISIPRGIMQAGFVIDVRSRVYGLSLAKSPVRLEDAPEQIRPAGNLNTYLSNLHQGRVRPTSIIIPIYNAFDAVIECVDSVLAKTPAEVEIVLIDDCSPDVRIWPLLQRYEKLGRVVLIRNDENLGYTRTINKAISLTKNNDVLLLNSDTVVTSRWYENLRYCAYSRMNVATVTAFSDNAGAFSAPEFGVYNARPSRLDPDSFSRAVTQATEGRVLEVPTGNGFCMFIRRDAMDKIGVFDSEKFPRGYGEENEFCMRAARAGWVNLVSDKVYVYHKRSQSFKDEKTALIEAGKRAVHEAYPEYPLLTKRFRDVEFSYVRSLMRSAVRSPNSGNARRILYVISTQTGGTPQTNRDLMSAMAGHFECYLLRCDSNTLWLSQLIDNELKEIEIHKLSRPIDPVWHRSEEYDRIVADILYRHSIELLHIRHIAWHSMGLADAAKSLRIPIVYSLHDFYSLCPSLNLLDENLQYCGGTCTPGKGTCQIALWPADQIPPLKNGFVVRWREMFDEFIRQADALITTSATAAKIFGTHFPEFANQVNVIAHGRDFNEFAALAAPLDQGQKIRVLVPGNTSLAKGARLFKEIAELDHEKRFEFHFLGDVWHGLKGVGVHHGKYDRGNFAEKVADISPHFGAILSIWPETYCHTLTELWSCGIPVFGCDIGAVGDRLGAAEAGWLLSANPTAADVLQAMNSLARDQERFERAIESVKKWQATEGVQNSTSTMAQQYRRIYSGLLNGSSSPGLPQVL